MERRKLLKFFPWMLSAFGLASLEKSYAGAPSQSSPPENRFKVLKESEIYFLPDSPKLGESIVFVHESGDWEKNSPTIKSRSHGINGKLGEDLLIDVNYSFGLRYLGISSGWQYFKSQA